MLSGSSDQEFRPSTGATQQRNRYFLHKKYATPRYEPITHSAPRGDDVGIEIPHKVRRTLGLDEAPSWVLVASTFRTAPAKNWRARLDSNQ